MRDDAYVAALDRLLLITVALHEDMTTSLEALGLTEARTRVVWELQRHGPMTQRDLAEALGISARGVTGLVDGLAATGFVTREPHPTDRRATLVTFTAAGAKTGAALLASQGEFAARLFADLPDLAAFTAGLDFLAARFVDLGVIR
jgi:DNA-binding MarR family transcriptional regulator